MLLYLEYKPLILRNHVTQCVSRSLIVCYACKEILTSMFLTCCTRKHPCRLPMVWITESNLKGLTSLEKKVRYIITVYSEAERIIWLERVRNLWYIHWTWLPVCFYQGSKCFSKLSYQFCTSIYVFIKRIHLEHQSNYRKHLKEFLKE